MTQRQRKSKAKVKRARHKRARVILDIETHSGIDAGSFRAPSPGVVAEYPVPFKQPEPAPPSRFLTINGRKVYKTVKELERDTRRHTKKLDALSDDLFAYSVFHPMRVKPGTFIVGRVMTEEEMRNQYSEASKAMAAGTEAHRQLEAYCRGAVSFDCTLYDVLRSYAHVLTRKKFNGKARKDRKGK